MKKFFEKKAMDYKFRKAGEGHSLSEEKPKPSVQPVKAQGTSEVCTLIIHACSYRYYIRGEI